ncbi:MAG: hypothetical protein ACJ8C4_02475 [Gemmataceae bacterium]
MSETPNRKSGPKEALHKVDLPFGTALGRLLKAKPSKPKKPSRKPKPKT